MTAATIPLPLRLFHWVLAASSVAAWALETVSRSAHVWLGYAAAAAVLWRVGYGLWGPPQARLVTLLHSPRRVWAWLTALLAGRAPLAHGYNPLAAWNVLAMLTTVLALAISGHLLRTDAFWGNETLQTAHTLSSDMFWSLVALHLLGLAVGSWRARYPLPFAMIDGREPPH